MRTTLDIDDDVLAAAKERARLEGKTTGRLVSELLRQAMTQDPGVGPGGVREPAPRYGFRPFASRGKVVSDERIARLREEEGI